MNGAPDPAALHRGIGRVVLLYAVLTAAWILLSDKTLKWLVDDPALLPVASTVKGWVFVAFSSLLLYAGLRRLPGIAGRSAAGAEPEAGMPKFMLALIGGGVALASALAMQRTFEHHLRMETNRLEAVADAKAGSLSDWLRERRGTAEFIRTSTFFAELYRQWRETGSRDAGERLQSRLEDLRHAHGFHGVVLLDAQGQILWASANAFEHADAETAAAVRSAQREHRVHWSSPHWDRNGNARLDFTVPLTAIEPHPVVVLQAEPADWLAPLLRNWPLPDSGGRVRLLWRDGDRARIFDPLGLGKTGEGPVVAAPMTPEARTGAGLLQGESGAEALGWSGRSPALIGRCWRD